jgi:UDP-3-O-[3-hydroxymyristoyl] N-acetylglucosamine deacetylase
MATTVDQTTIRQPIDCTGVGLHSGAEARMTLCPADAGAGIVFVRTDRAGARVPARYDHVVDTRLGTTLAEPGGALVHSVEHLMAALWGCGIDNLVVELDGPEVPVMDGSAEPFVFLVECAGIRRLDAPRRVVRVLEPVRVADGARSLSLTPDDRSSVHLEIEFAHPVIGRQALDYDCDDGSFKDELARARTFGLESEVTAMRASGRGLGGSLGNAVVVGEDRVLNEGGLRFPDEFVRHKVLDCLGDLYLAGARIVGRLEAVRAGHRLNNALLHRLFASPANVSLEAAALPDWTDERVAALA